MALGNRKNLDQIVSRKILLHAGYFRSLAVAVGLSLSLLLSANANSLDKLSADVRDIRQAILFDGEVFSGPGYRTLVEEGRNAHFFLIGEEHGIAENPLLAAQLFSELADHGYRRLAIEVSPPMASALDQAAANGGLDGLRALYAQPGGEPAFFGMQEEAELLATVRASVPDDEPAFWGFDYEVAGDRTLLRRLDEIGPPKTAQEAFDTLVQTANMSWRQWEDTGNPGFVFSFSTDPKLIADLRQQWPDRSLEVDTILDTLEQTLMINQRWVAGDSYGSNVLRGRWLRQNFINYWQTLPDKQDRPKIMAKFGASHIIRGLNMNNTWDIGALIPELARIEGLESVSILVLPGPEAQIARFDPTRWAYGPVSSKGGYSSGLEPLFDAIFDDQMTLIPIEPLRAHVLGSDSIDSDRLIKTVAGFDYLLIMRDSTPAGELNHD